MVFEIELLLRKIYSRESVAPISANFATNFSASSRATPFLITFGALSTRSLDSFNPSPVNARISLITEIFFSAWNSSSLIATTDFSSTFFSSFFSSSSPPSSAASAAGAAAAYLFFDDACFFFIILKTKSRFK